jgi:hypothetical protein
VKLADFGIAKAVDRRERSVTGVIKGKFAYMSPEQSLGSELDARSDLFAVGTLLYLLTTGKKPFEGETDVDVLMKVRKARYEKPSEVVKDFNLDVERFIARALRVDLSRRWQNAEQMADKLDAILAKLGQPSGPSLLKRWLETLGAKDGVKAPADAVEVINVVMDPGEEPPPPPETGTVELASRDLELEDVAPPPAAPDDDPPTRRQPKRGRGRTQAAPGPHDAATRALSPPADVLAAEAAFGAPTRMVRVGRWLRRTTLVTLVVVGLTGGAAYLARSHLPRWLVDPVETWLHSLPWRLGSGTTSEPPPPPPKAPARPKR